MWQPKGLKHDKSLGWKADGPNLPIEFARISKDGRLTLVITATGTDVPTLYTLSECKTIDEAISDLATREESGKKSIGWYDKSKDEFHPKDFKYPDVISEWIKDRDFDAVIWTNLGEKWERKNGKGKNEKVFPDKRMDYLRELKGANSISAEQYIRKAPKQIKTRYREMIEQELGWIPIE